MKNDIATLKKIANVSGSTVSTFSKALRHCFGVDVEKRAEILKNAERLGYTPSREKCDIYIIIPSSSVDYWKNVMYAMSEAFGKLYSSGIYIKYNVCPRHSPDIFRSYIADAVSRQAQVIIIAVKSDSGYTEALEQTAVSRICRVIYFLEKPRNICATDYIGTEPFDDGKRAYSLSPPCNAIILTDSSRNADERAEGFQSCSHLPYKKVSITDSGSAYTIARALFDRLDGNIDCVYTTGGNILSTITAVKKLRSGVRYVIGHDYYPRILNGEMVISSDKSLSGEIFGIGFHSLYTPVKRLCDELADALSYTV